MTSTNIVDVVDGWCGAAYDEKGAATKQKFHRLAATKLRALAVELALPASSYEVRSNKAGDAVTGEVTLHGEQVYVQVTGLQGILARTCKGRRDYGGGRNHWLPLSLLDDVPRLAQAIKGRLEREKGGQGCSPGGAEPGATLASAAAPTAT
jgi:hypothetical protein